MTQVFYPNYSYQRDYLAFLKNENLFALNQLSGEAREKALQEMIESQEWWRRKYLQDQKDFIQKMGIHTWINLKGREMKKSVHIAELNKRLKTDPKYLEGFTLDNLQEFKEDGSRIKHYSLFDRPDYRTIQINNSDFW